MIKFRTLVLISCVFAADGANAAENCCASVISHIPTEASYTTDASCTTKVSGEGLNTAGCCKSTSISSTTDGVIKTRACSTNATYDRSTGVVSARCDCGIPTYKCAIGYYGSPTNETSGCTRCPASGGVYGTTASAGATSVTECYLRSGTAFSDASGSGRHEGKCYYSN